jgi:hypothetical protein
MTDDADEYEVILPAERPTNTVVSRTSAFAAALRRPDTGGVFASKATRWRIENQTRALKAMAKRAYAEADYFDAQVQLIDSYIRAAGAADMLQELPAILALDRIRRKADRAEDGLELAHRRTLAKHRRAVELARARQQTRNADQAWQAARERYEPASQRDGEFFCDQSRPRRASTDDAAPSEEHVLMAARILRQR